ALHRLEERGARGVAREREQRVDGALELVARLHGVAGHGGDRELEVLHGQVVALQDAVLLGQCRSADQHEQRCHDGYGSQTSDHAASSRAARAASTAPTFTLGLVSTTSPPPRSGNRNRAPEGRSRANSLRVPSRPRSRDVARASPGSAASSTPSPLPSTTSAPLTATTWRTVSRAPKARSALSTSASSSAGRGAARGARRRDGASGRASAATAAPPPAAPDRPAATARSIAAASA